MSKRKLSVIDEGKNKKFKADPDYEDVSESLSNLSISEDDINDMAEELRCVLKEECENDADYYNLNNTLSDLCKNMDDKKITLTKLLNSNLLPEEKEKSIQLYSILLETNPNSFEYIQLHKLLQDMIAGTLSQLTSAESNIKLKEFQDELLAQTPTLDKIIAAKISHQDKMLAIQLFQTFYQTSINPGGLYSAEWFAHRKRIIEILENPIKNDIEFTVLEKEETLLKNYNKIESSNLKTNILKLDVAIDIKKKIYDMYQYMISIEDERDRQKLNMKLKWLIGLPYQKITHLPKSQKYCDEVYQKLSTNIYGMNHIKEKLLIHLNNRIHHKKTMSILALRGNPGVGKTKIIQCLSEASGIPYAKLSLGGVSDTTLIYGHNQVWDNSGPGMILQYMSRYKCSDLIIMLDEIDKLSNTDKGLEVQHALLHLLDQTQNKEFHDAYLDEFPHDISRIWFIATLNDETQLSQPLKDRLDILEVPFYTKEEIVNIIIKHILPQAVKDCGLNEKDITISETACHYMISCLSTDIKHSGMRLVEKEIKDLVLKLSFLNNTTTEVSFKLKDFKGFPYRIDKKTLKAIVSSKPKPSSVYHMMYC